MTAGRHAAAADENNPGEALARGKFITFEGGEGSGKTTQSARLAARLSAIGLPVIETREPGGAPGAEAIRQLLVTGDVDRWDPIAEALLHCAARRDHVVRLIEPALAAGRWVLSDRFADSTMAYQGFGHALGWELVETLSRTVLGDLVPDLTIILDVPVEIGLARAHARKTRGAAPGDRYERMDAAFHARLRAGYHEIARRNPDRCLIFDGTMEVDALSATIWPAVAERFGLGDKDASHG